MKHLVDIVRDGATTYYAASGRVEFRKPRVFDPAKQLVTDYKFAEAKIDGNRVVCVGHLEERRMSVITSNGIDVFDEVRQCHWANLLFKRMNDLELFEGELYLPGQGREALSTAMANRDPNIRFAVLGHSGTPSGAILSELDRVVFGKKCDLDRPAWAEICSEETGILIKSRQEPVTRESLLANVSALGVHYDGIVLKNGMYSEWAKFKHKKRIDVVVVGLQAAKEGKFEGMVGSLLCGIYDAGNILYEVARCSGMNDEVRKVLSESDIGRVVEIEYERVGSRGRLQSPQFKLWRDDKKPEDCKLDQDPALAAAYAEDEEE